MRQPLLNHQPEPRSRETLKTKRLNAMTIILMALFVMLLTPQGIWAQTNYPFTIGGVQITDANIGTGTYEHVSYDKTNYTITLSGVVNLEQILWNDSHDLTIALNGTNNIQASPDSATHIRSEYKTAKLKFKIVEGSSSASLYMHQNDQGTNAPSVISGFESISYEGLYLKTGVPTDFKNTQIASGHTLTSLVSAIDNACIHVATITSTETYPLWVAGTQVDADNKGDVLGSAPASAPTVSYEPSNNTLTLNGVSNTSSPYSGDYIVSNMAKLNVDLHEVNNIRCSGAAFRNLYNGSTLFFKTTNNYAGSLIVTSSGTSGATLYNGFNASDVTFDNDLEYDATSTSININTKHYNLYVGHPDLFVTIKNKDNITVPYGFTLGTDGKISYDPSTHTLTIKNATIDGEGIKWGENAGLTINIIGTNTITTSGFNNCIKADGQAAAPTLTIDRGDNNDCSLVLNSETGTNVIGGFSSTTPTVGTGLRWTENTEDAKNNVTKATVAVDYGLSVGGTYVTSANASDVLGDGKVLYDKASNTLTLQDGTAVNGGIWYDSNLPSQKIVLNGTVTVTNPNGTYAIYSNSGAITVEKGTGVTSAGLTATCGSGYVPIERNIIALGEGLYWKPTATTTAIVDDPKFILVKGALITNGQTINGATSGTITYTESDHTLTFNNFVDNGNFTSIYAVETGIDKLTVKLVGDNTITWSNTDPGDVAFKGTHTNAAIEFTKEGNATLTLAGTTKAIDGFATDKATLDGLVCYNSGTDQWTIRKISTPELSAAVNTTDNFTYATIDYAAADKSGTNVLYASQNPKLKYSFDYTDASLTDVTNADYPAGGIKMTNPGILTAWVEVGSAKSEVVTGVRFGMTENVINAAYNGAATQTLNMDLQPAGKLADVDISLQNNPTWVTAFDQSNKELTVSGCGMSNFSLSFTPKKTNNIPFTTLGDDGNNVKFAIEVLPPAPTIDGSKATVDTDNISITSSVGSTTTIFYTWGTATIGKNYTHSVDTPVLTVYNGTGVPAQNGTLRAWVGYTDGRSNTYIMSEVASQAFTGIKTNISGYYVADITSQTYSGAALTPAITVKASETAATALTAGTDYTVSYQQDGKDVTSLVNAGTYNVTITGAGNYAGTITSKTFTIEKATPTVTAPTAKNLSYTGNAQELVNAGSTTAGTLQYKLGANGTYGTAIPSATAADSYAVYYKVVGNSNINDVAEAGPVSITIAKVDLTNATIDAIADQTYTGSAIEPMPTVKFNGLAVATDEYSVSYENNTYAGTATVKVKATGKNFTKDTEAVTNFTIKNKVLSASNVFTGGKQYTHYYSTEDLDLGAGIAVYVITDVTGGTAVTRELKYIPKNVPVLLESISGSSTATETSADSNMLKYTSTDVTLPKANGTAYMLYNNMYIRVTGNEVPAGKTYLWIPASKASNARQLSIGHNDNTTGIDSVKSSIEENGQDIWFDMQGRRINHPTKDGLYIKNGKKTVINQQ